MYQWVIAFPGFGLKYMQHRIDFGCQCCHHIDFAIMLNCFLSWNNYSDANLFIYIATSHPSEGDNDSTAMANLTALLILEEFQ